MQEEVRTITLAMPFRLGTVNCYLIKTGNGYVLIDSGGSNNRSELLGELEEAGCAPGNLKLIVLTHGDFDHTGNAAYLRQKHGAKIAMHRGDAGMAEQGDMFWNRGSGNAVIRFLAPILFRFGKANRFQPDVWVEEGSSLSEYGLDATVLSIPGHSKGSIGILTANGDLFCGDLFENTKQPAIGSIMDDPQAANASVETFKEVPVRTVYPGHGRPFTMAEFTH